MAAPQSIPLATTGIPSERPSSTAASFVNPPTISVDSTILSGIIAGEGAALQGAVTRVAPSVDPASGTVRVVVEADNPSLKMKPGVEAEVEIVP